MGRCCMRSLCDEFAKSAAGEAWLPSSVQRDVSEILRHYDGISPRLGDEFYDTIGGTRVMEQAENEANQIADYLRSRNCKFRILNEASAA